MNEQSSKTKREVWVYYCRASENLEDAKFELLHLLPDELEEMVISALAIPSQRRFALNVIKNMDGSSRQKLLPNVLPLACFQNQVTELATEVVLSLPQSWLLRNLRPIGEEALAGADPQGVDGFLRLCSKMDRDLCVEIASDLVHNDKPEIKGIAHWWLKTLKK